MSIIVLMKKIILIILLVMKSEMIGGSTDTYICKGEGSSYSCTRYIGGDLNVYHYSESYYKDIGSVHEFDDHGTGNPYASEDACEEIEDSKDVAQDPSVAPYFNSFTGTYYIPVQVKK